MKVIGLILFILQWSGAAQCGFDKMLNFKHNPPAHPAASAWRATCPPELLYDQVELKTTPHFRILYTLSGPHAIPAVRADSLLDSLALWLERAYQLHTDSLGMRAPWGSATSYHFQDARFPEKYPVEIIDIGLLRDTYSILGGTCGACYGLTIPDAEDFRRSGLLLDNDFKYPDGQASPKKLSYTSGDNDKSCQYPVANTAILGELHGKVVDYSQNWRAALKVSTFHELYHACQLRYQDYAEQYHFWFEASATGVEAVAVPESGDYLQYLPQIFNQTEVSIVDVTNPFRPYGQAVFYHSLFAHLGPQFDHQIWSALEKHPSRPLTQHLEQVLAANSAGGLASFVNLHARNLAFAGARTSANFTESEKPWHPDLHLWPEVNPQATVSSGDYLEAWAFKYYAYSSTNWQILQQSEAQVAEIQGQKDHFIVVSSGEKPIDLAQSAATKPTTAWPNPWRPHQGLLGHERCYFNPTDGRLSLPIRDRAGKVIITLQRSLVTEPFSWDGRLENSQFALPGIYYWQSAPQTAPQRLIILR